jgi:hypothetical protein
MNLKHRAHADKAGLVKPVIHARQKCNECGKVIKPLFKPTSHPEDWLWLDCNTCLGLFCEDCCNVTAEGVTECRLCYQTRLARQDRRRKLGSGNVVYGSKAVISES